MGKFDIPGVTKSNFSSIQDGEEWSQQVQKSDWFKSRMFINKIEILLWIRLTLRALEYYIRKSKLANVFANDGDFKNDAIKTGSFKDYIFDWGDQDKKHQRNMQEADFEIHKELLKEHKDNANVLSICFFALKSCVKYSYFIINGIILAFLIWVMCHYYEDYREKAALNSTANEDIAPAWYEPGQKTYESILKDCKVGTKVLEFGGSMQNHHGFSMTLCLEGKKATGAYVYYGLEQLNRNLPKQSDYNDNTENSNYICAALKLEGEVKGDITTPGKKISINLNEYDINNHKVGSFKGTGTVQSSDVLRIKGVFKNHKGQKIDFEMDLTKSIDAQSFAEIVNGMLTRKSISNILYVADNESPFAIVVKNNDIVPIKYSGSFADYDRINTPNLGSYNKDNIIIGDDYIIMREKDGDIISYYSTMDKKYSPTVRVKVLDLHEQNLKVNDWIGRVVWDNDSWNEERKFYSVFIDDKSVTVKGYDQYGKVISDITIPIFHAYVPAPGIIIGETWGEMQEGSFHQDVITKVFDFEGNELEGFNPDAVKIREVVSDYDDAVVIGGE